MGKKIIKSMLKMFSGGGGFATLHGMWDLSSPTRDQTCARCSESEES